MKNLTILFAAVIFWIPTLSGQEPPPGVPGPTGQPISILSQAQPLLDPSLAAAQPKPPFYLPGPQWKGYHPIALSIIAPQADPPPTAAELQALAAESCAAGAPGKWSYLSPIVKDSCGKVDRFGSLVTLGSGLATITDVGTTLFYLHDKRYTAATGTHEANPFLSTLFKHEPAGYLFPVISVAATNATANFILRHGTATNRKVMWAESIGLFALKNFWIFHNLQAYRSFEAKYAGVK